MKDLIVSGGVLQKMKETKETIKTPILSIVFFFAITYSYAQQGTMTDPRDGRVYKTIEIGSKIWMAENLDPKDTVVLKVCYDDNELFCERYGGLYNWESAKKACPVGWHLPSKIDYDELLSLAGDSGGSRYKNLLTNGKTGINLMLGGWFYGGQASRFMSLAKTGFYWTSTEAPKEGNAYRLGLVATKVADIKWGSKKNLHSVRCVKD